MSDGSFWSDEAEVVVTLAACLEDVIMARALINVPPKAKRGDIIEIKTLISHPMETGYRPDSTGNVRAARHHQRVRLHL